MANRKIVCLGGGSLYFRRALKDLPLDEGLAGSEVVLYDIDHEKADRMAAMGRRLAGKTSTGLSVRAAKELADAVDGADFAISSIGGSGAEVTRSVYGSYYHAADVHIPARYGVHQVIGDTCGPAGMMMGLRSIPAYMEICREMEKRCPGAILLNHSNPMAVLMRAMHKYTGVNAVGICHGVQGGIVRAAKLLGVPPEELECVWIGTNHYYWFTRVTHGGRDVLRELMRRMEEGAAPEGEGLSWDLSAIYGHRICYTPDDHIIEFYPFLTQVGDAEEMPYGLQASAERHGYDAKVPMPKREPPTAELRAEFMKNYRAILDQVEPADRMDDSITGEGVASMVGAMANGRRQLFLVNVANGGAIPNLPATAEVEVEAVTGSRGVRPLVMGEAPPVLKGILEKRFAWQELVADAAVKGDRNLALQALMVDEMAIRPEKARAMLDELLEASKDLLPQFFQ